jgi:hypothetical protein
MKHVVSDKIPRDEGGCRLRRCLKRPAMHVIKGSPFSRCVASLNGHDSNRAKEVLSKTFYSIYTQFTHTKSKSHEVLQCQQFLQEDCNKCLPPTFQQA